VVRSQAGRLRRIKPLIAGKHPQLSICLTCFSSAETPAWISSAAASFASGSSDSSWRERLASAIDNYGVLPWPT